MKKLILILLCGLLLIGCSNAKQTVTEEKWGESPLFISGNYTMMGEKGRLGFIYDDSEVLRFYPNKIQKYMWHFWGKDQEFKGKLKVVAKHENGNEQLTILKDIVVSGAHNGADRHIPSNMSLPNSGMWKLDAYFGDKLFGSIYVKVHKKNEKAR